MTSVTATQSSSQTMTDEQAAIILIADKFDAAGIEAFESRGHRVVCDPSLSPETLPEAIEKHDPHVLIVRSTKVHADAIEKSRRLALIVRSKGGRDRVGARVGL